MTFYLWYWVEFVLSDPNLHKVARYFLSRNS